MTTPQELIAATKGSVQTVGARFYFDPSTVAVGRELGLDGFRFYVLGRGGVLGDVEAPVITSAFGYFHPGVIDKIWNSARAVVAPRDAARAQLGCGAEIGRGALHEVPGLDTFCAAAEQVIADVNPAGLALYAGVAAEPLPDDLPGRAMQLIIALRELRGSQHLAAVITSQLHPGVAHALRRPGDIESFGWPADIEIPADGPTKLAAADGLTDEMNADSYRSLTDEQRTAFVQGMRAIEGAFSS